MWAVSCEASSLIFDTPYLAFEKVVDVLLQSHSILSLTNTASTVLFTKSYTDHITEQQHVLIYGHAVVRQS